MESTRAHRITRLDPTNGSVKITGKPDMRTDRHRGHLHLQRTVIFLVALTIQPQSVCAVGMFELQIRHFQNPHGLLQTGDCCDLQASGGQRCSSRDQCDTFFQACLKEYQARVAPTGACTFGSGTTGILGGNSQSLRHRGQDGGGGGGGGGGGEDGINGHIVIPFKYAWPKSFSLVLEALDYDNDTSESGQLIERVLLSSMLNPGEQWQTYRHHGRTLSLEYRLRFRCDSNYYGPFCNKFCRARDDFFGHFSCDPSGSKVCMDGWTGVECKEAVCRQGCHQTHGFCTVPGECKCHYGWTGPLCDQCVTFPGCVYGSCTEPWKCVCDVNWGGLLCDKDLNYCGTHQPCKNGGTCTNTEPNEYQCECQEGFRGRNCDIVEHACLSSPCANGATCIEDPTGFNCICTDGWTGHTCADAVRQCDRSPCGRGATCQEAPRGYRCLCPPGWTGRTCQLDTNECEMNICAHARSCRNLIGGYLCDCLPGWTGSNCDIRNSSCQGLCLNGGRCEDQMSGSRCLCPPGFSGKYCQISLSPCDSAPCLHGGQCVEKDGQTVTCNCPMGYSGIFCEVVLDLCNPNPCQQGVPCHSTEGRYTCACPEGYYGNECMSLKNPCIGPHCPGAMSDTTHGGVSFYMVLVGVLALVTVCGCAACAFILSHLHQKRKKQQAIPQEEGINNQREFVNLIRNVDRPVPLLPPAAPLTHAPAPAPVSRCYEEIELTLPPSPAPSHSSPALKPAHAPKLDISNREREKLNRFHYTDNQELEV
ncbi:protein jagged-2 isoform X1 [Thunnus maccoyii]|uniref:protein jagged-2 isoform X1 n=1 Tax=Thunnus maccoyii TaxID=8240 RepID=UPI001C4B4CB2|nr:protein jagged-2 isoform X1 [Thunnus maccoyii]